MKEKIAKLEAGIEGTKGALEEQKGRKEEMKAELDKLESQKQDFSQQIGEIFKKKDELREEFYKKKYEVKKQQEDIKKLDVMHKRKNRLVEVEERKKGEEEMRKTALENRPHPYIREMEICEDLVIYCKRIQGVPIEEVKAEAKTFHNEMREREIKDAIVKQVKDRKIVAHDVQAMEADKQSDIFAGFAASDKKKGRKRKGNQRG